jgi:16S rRNA (guanine527-N7)-methyltransferase
MLSANELARMLGVSRETLARLETYVALLRAWNPRINLVSVASLGDVWRRHILDSAQLMAHIPDGARVLVDLGSGAGLPGLILGIMGMAETHLIESDQRKSAFLREAARVTETRVALHVKRIEAVKGITADVITAAKRTWIMETQALASRSDDKGQILRVEGLRRVSERH